MNVRHFPVIVMRTRYVPARYAAAYWVAWTTLAIVVTVLWG